MRSPSALEVAMKVFVVLIVVLSMVAIIERVRMGFVVLVTIVLLVAII